MSCVDAYPETVKSQKQMLLNFLILQAVSTGIIFPPYRFFSVVIPTVAQRRPGIQECGLLYCF